MSGEKQENGMDKREKVIRGLEAHANPKSCETYAGEECPYYNLGDSDPKITCSSILAADALALLKEYDTALKLMVFQYCTVDEGFYNRFMSAGEEAFRVLGIENGQSTDGVWEKWFSTNERGKDNA